MRILSHPPINRRSRPDFKRDVKTEIDLLLHARWVIPIEPTGVVHEHYAIAVTGGRIHALVPSDTADARYRARETVRLDRHVVIPGLVNAHTHAAMNLFRGIADDLRLATDPIVEFAIGFINALASAVTFVSILFVVGGAISFSVGDTVLVIPGYIAIAAVIYAATVSSATYFIGYPLVGKVAAKNESEAQFRYELTRVREDSAVQLANVLKAADSVANSAPGSKVRFFGGGGAARCTASVLAVCLLESALRTPWRGCGQGGSGGEPCCRHAATVAVCGARRSVSHACRCACCCVCSASSTRRRT